MKNNGLEGKTETRVLAKHTEIETLLCFLSPTHSFLKPLEGKKFEDVNDIMDFRCFSRKTFTVKTLPYITL